MLIWKSDSYSTAICWFPPHMPTPAGVGPGRSQELWAQSRSPAREAEAHGLGTSLLLAMVGIGRKLALGTGPALQLWGWGEMWASELLGQGLAPLLLWREWKHQHTSVLLSLKCKTAFFSCCPMQLSCLLELLLKDIFWLWLLNEKKLSYRWLSDNFLCLTAE